MPLGYIYTITNLSNNRLYMGSSINPTERKYQHFSNLKTNKHDNPYLQNAFNLYGKDNFELKIIATAIDVTREELYEIEADYRERLNTYWPNGYNINKAIIGPPILTGENHPAKRPEVRQKISKGLIGKKLSEEHKQKLREAKLGKKQTKEHITNAAKTRIGHVVSSETRDKISKANTGKIRTLEMRKRISEAGREYNQRKRRNFEERNNTVNANLS